VWNSFFEDESNLRRALPFCEKQPRRAHDQVVFSAGECPISAAKIEIVSRCDLERIAQRDRRDECSDLVKTIFAAPKHTQRKIDFRVGQFLHTLRSVHEFGHIDEMKSARDRLIIALDVTTRAEAISLALELAPCAGWMKIGLQLFTAEGPDLVRAIRGTGAKVFLDLKLHDIPNTAARAVESAAQLEVQMLTLHLSGGAEMIRAATSAAPPSLLLLGVTLLTSADDETLRAIGVADAVGHQVLRLAKLGVDNGIRGLVTSAHEVAAIRKAMAADVKLIVPGIRHPGSDANDQRRTMAPGEAIAAGADYLVVGRLITGAPDPAAAAEQILKEIES
jgi:orotidine-5'-phosphate decarboxylase